MKFESRTGSLVIKRLIHIKAQEKRKKKIWTLINLKLLQIRVVTSDFVT